MSGRASPPSSSAAGRPRRSRWRDPRLWIGAVITVVTVWLALRGVDFPDMVRDLARANLPLVLGVSVPAYLAMVWLRAVRWRYLTDAVMPISTAPLFRATAVGFLANNIFPLRIGEVVRAWFLARETRIDVGPIFGTIVLERVIDGLCVVAMAAVVFGVRGSRSGDALFVGLPLLMGALVPLGGVLMLRFAPEWTIGWVRTLARIFLPARTGEALEGMIRRISEGLASIQGGRHLWWVALHSVAIWVVLGVVPFLAGFAALGIDLGSVRRTLAASFVTQTAVGIAVALPSAPGFFGPYHLACREALARFGVAEEPALALGTLSHAVFWGTTSALGLLVLRRRGARLEDLAEVAEESEATAVPPEPGGAALAGATPLPPPRREAP